MSGWRDDRVTGGQDDHPSSSAPPLDGAFLLQMLQRPPQSQFTAPPAYPPHEARQPHRDPAVAAVYKFLPHNLLPPPRPPAPSPPPPPDYYTGPLRFSPPPLSTFPQGSRAPPGFPPPGINHRNSHTPANRTFFRGDPKADSSSSASDPRSHPRYLPRDGFAANSNLHSFPSARTLDSRSMPNPRPEFRKVTAGSVARVDAELASRRDAGIGSAGSSRGPVEQNHFHSEKGRNAHSGPQRHDAFPRPGMAEQGRPPGPPPRSKAEWVALKGRVDGGHSMEKAQDHWRKENDWTSPSPPGDFLRERSTSHANDGEIHSTRSLISCQLDQSVDVSIRGSDGEEHHNDTQYEVLEGNTSKALKHDGMDGFTKDACKEPNALADQLMDALISMNDPVDKKVMRHSDSRRDKGLRSDSLRGGQVLSQRMRIRRREIVCRHDIETFAPCFLSIYESLIPADEEKAKQKQLLLSLGKLVTKEWPNAQLHLYGSCANSFGVSKSDIDICLAIDDSNMSKSDILLKLADILQSDNLQNVQALTHARVPIVKMMDPVTGISCDICINNLLAVVNTKLLRDYAQIDERLHQLAFIVKHWAKSRGVNETYRGTLSSYAYVLMCIHFLQLRMPSILPCLQEMDATYFATVEDTECTFFDQVEELRGFGARNKESIARLLWAFFQYWAYYHDYMNDVISVRTGRIISKRAKDWTRRIGNDRHLICIEDPFETSHDLGRVVDKFSIKILREEFERAAYILQYDLNPSVTLFEPYVPESTQS